MPVFEVQGPDGGIYEVEANDEAHALSAFGGMQHSATSESTDVNAAADAAKSFASGIGRGVAAVPGFAGDVHELAKMAPWAPKRSMYDALTEYAGIKPPTSQETIAAASNVAPFIGYEPQTKAGEFARRVGEFIPSALTAGEGRLVSNAARYGVVPAVSSKVAEDAAAGTGYEAPASVIGALAGGIAGGSAMRGGHAATPERVTRGLLKRDPLIARDVETLQNAGVNLTAGQISGNNKLQWLEDAADKVPFGANVYDTQKADLNRALFEKAGAGSKLDHNTGQFTPETWLGAKDNFGKWYDELTRNSAFKYDPNTNNAIQGIRSRYNSFEAPAFQKPVVNDWLDKLEGIAVNGGQLSGDVAKQWRSELAKAAKALRDTTHGEALSDLVKVVDSNLRANSPEHLRNTWSKVDRAYSNYRMLKDASKAAGSTNGFISPAILRGIASRRNLDLYNTGQSDLGELSKAAQNVMREKPSSGSAERIGAGVLLSTAGGLAALPKAIVSSRVLASKPMRDLLVGKKIPARAARPARPFNVYGAVSPLLPAGLLGP